MSIQPGTGAMRPEAALAFEPHRRRLTGLAYRMLGSMADAEDILQEAFLRWLGSEAPVENAGAYLTRVVTRLCLDQLKSARARREIYVGPWLPEPVLDAEAISPDSHAEIARDLSVALLLALERLSPLERAAFLLHDVFDEDFDSVAEALGRSPAACRQLAARARANLRGDRRFPVSPEEGDRIAAAFQQASMTGDAAALAALLAEQAVLVSDGGGNKIAARRPIRGRERIARFFSGIARKQKGPARFRVVRINGMPGVVSLDAVGELQTAAFEIEDGLITAIHVVRNPEKLRHLPKLLDPGS